MSTDIFSGLTARLVGDSSNLKEKLEHLRLSFGTCRGDFQELKRQRKSGGFLWKASLFTNAGSLADLNFDGLCRYTDLHVIRLDI